MTTIAALRTQRTNLLADIKKRETGIKELDAAQRVLRGEIAKLKTQERELSSKITKMAKEEL